MVLVAPGLAGFWSSANEGPGAAEVPAVHYKRATRLCTLAAEMLFTQSLEGCCKRPMRARAGTPCVVRNAQSCQRDRLTGAR